MTDHICNARGSRAGQELTAQREGLIALGVDAKLIYVGHGLTGRNRERPGSLKPSPLCARGTLWW